MTTAGRGVDFIVFGVPRSGTSNLARAISQHHGLYCGLEFYPWDWKLSDRDPAVDFANDELLPPTANRATTREQLKSLGKRATSFGDKNPRFYATLPELAVELPECALFGIYRPGLGFCDSYNRRAAEAGKWHPGQTGLTAVLDLTEFLLALTAKEARGVNLLSYNALYYRNFTTMMDVYRLLAGPVPDDARRRFRSGFFRLFGDTAPAPVLTEDEAELAAAIDIAIVDRLLDRNGLTSVGSVQREVTSWLAAAIPTLARRYRDLSDAQVEWLAQRGHWYRRVASSFSGRSHQVFDLIA